MAKKDTRVVVTMTCTVCKSQNYTTEKSKINDPDRLTLVKFCSNCGKHTEHNEAKK